MATDNVKVIKIDTNAAQTSVKDLRKELKELRTTLLNTEEGTEEYNNAMRQAADIQHTLKEQMEEVNASAMDFGEIVGNVVKVTGGMVAGFQAAKATMNLFGVENEAVLKSLEKMQNLMAITQAIPSLDDGFKAFKRLSTAISTATGATSKFGKALVSTGLGAIVVALGLLAANWDKVTEAMRKWGIISGETKKELEEQTKKVEELRGDLSKMESDYDKWIKDKKASKLNSEAKKSYDDLSDSINNYQKQLDIIVAKQKLPENQSRANWDALQKEGQALQNNISELKKQQQAILDNADSYKELDKSVDNTVEKIKESKKQLEVLLWDAAQKLAPQSLQDELLAKFGGSGVPLPVKIEIEEDEESDTSFEDSFRQKIQGTIDSLRQSFGISEEEQYQQEINALEVSLKTKLISEEEYYKLRDSLNKEYTQREIQRYSLAANSIGSIFSSLGEFMEEGSKEQKAMQIMGATLNMLGGITAAISGAFTTHSGPWDIALAALQATSIAASGAATIAQMAKTNKNNASSISASPNTRAINSVIAPVQYTQDVQGANIEGAIRDSKQYVAVTEINEVGNRVEVTEQEAKF